MYLKIIIIVIQKCLKKKKILKYNYREKSIKTQFIINADMECLFERTDTCHDNPKRSSTTKITKHLVSCYSMFIHCSFHATRNRLDYYRGKDCMKKKL